jgi:hypothetical protein
MKKLVFFLALLVASVASYSTNKVGCPDSTSCTGNVVKMCFDEDTDVDDIDKIKYTLYGSSSSWNWVDIDSVVGNCIYFTKPTFVSCSDTLLSIKFYEVDKDDDDDDDDDDDVDELEQIGRCNDDIPLPVDLLYFRGSRNIKGLVELDWATAMELDNSHFLIQRTDGTSGWTTLIKEPSKSEGFSSTVLFYTYFDKQVLPELTYYYRLIQFDYNGDYSISNVIVVYGDKHLFRQGDWHTYDVLGRPNQKGLIRVFIYEDGTIRK